MTCRIKLFAALLLFCAAQLTYAQDLFNVRSGNPVPEKVEQIYKKGLAFLVKTQSKSGRWSDNYGNQPGVVGLAVLAMLAHGEDPNFGPYSKSIRNGIDSILGSSNKSNGYIGSSMYNHGFATLALAEAYGAVNNKRIGPALEKAVKLLITSQKRNSRGAWRYGPQSMDADTTVAGACMVALFAARNAGIAVPDKSIKKALLFYKTCQNFDGGFGYTGPGGSNCPRTAIGALVFALARKYKSKELRSAMAYLKQHSIRYNHYYYYYLYYMAQASFQIDFEYWQKWNGINIKKLADTQKPDGSWSGNKGSTFTTAASLLSLALNYRFLPIYER